MVDPVIDQYLNSQNVEVLRPEPSDTDDEVIELAQQNRCPILTRDRDFVKAHREDQDHYGIIFDSGMHHRPPREELSALTRVLDLLDAQDLRSTVVRLKKFY
ncbi:hypothetical protein GJ632_00430 [Halogeometricum sp. CBA1124]|nr:hypothetical protein [Halogeometricum sp. CBA1124]